MPMRSLTLSTLVATSLALIPGASADITEGFMTPVSVSSGSTLGACNQITVGTSSGGAVTVGGGSAFLKTSSEADTAMLYSTLPLPGAAYKVSVEVSDVAYPQYTLTNGVTLLAIVDTKPQSASDLWWGQHRMIGVEVDVAPGAANKYPLYFSYWDSSTIYTWDGTKWVPGSAGLKPVMTYDPIEAYTITISKTPKAGAPWYVISISANGVVLAAASVPAKDVRPAAAEYFVVGDRLTNYFKGSMDVDSLSMPMYPSCGVPDGGLPDSAPPGDMALSDAAATDGAGPADLALDSGPGDGANGDGANGDGASSDSSSPSGDASQITWDLFTPEASHHLYPGSDGGSCGCELGARPAARTGVSLLALILAILIARRRGS